MRTSIYKFENKRLTQYWAFKVVLPEILPKDAKILAVPTATGEESPVLFIVATEMSEELQVTCVVISQVVPSVYAAVALNC